MDLAASLKYRSHPSSHPKYLAKHHIGFLKHLYTSSKLVFQFDAIILIPFDLPVLEGVRVRTLDGRIEVADTREPETLDADEYHTHH